MRSPMSCLCSLSVCACSLFVCVCAYCLSTSPIRIHHILCCGWGTMGTWLCFHQSVSLQHPPLESSHATVCSKIHYNTNMSDNYWWWWSICEGSTNILIYGRRQEDKETHKIRLQNRSLEFFRVPESVIAINFCLSYIIHPPPFRKCSM